MSDDGARAVADAVLFEGYSLYPYRRSKKDLARWQFGVLAPRAYCESAGGDTWWAEARFLVEGGRDVRLEGTLRFLRLCRRRVQAPDPATGRLRPVESVDVGGRLIVGWDEGETHEVAFEGRSGASDEAERAFSLAAAGEDEVVRGDGTEDVAAHVERRSLGLAGAVRVRVRELALARPCVEVAVRVENRTEWRGAVTRDDAIAASLLGVHLLVTVAGGRALSAFDPPAWAADAAAACKGAGLFPVLTGNPSLQNAVLAAPIILYDFPHIAPESPGDLFDATEIDEILTLRARALTDDEKREARATDPRVAALIDRVDGTSDEALAKMHGAFRDPRARDAPIPSTGEHVVLRPGPRRTDAQDMFLAGMTATIRSVLRDVDGRVCLAVTVDADPAAELHLERGRFHYFYLDEVERLDTAVTST